MFIPLLAALIPSLVGIAEKAIVGDNQGDAKKAWVLGMLDELFSVLDKKGVVPAWAKVAEGPIKDILDHFIEDAVSKL